MWADRPALELFDYLTPGFVKEDFVYGLDEQDAAQREFRRGAILVIFSDFPAQFESIYRNRGKERLLTIFDGLTVLGQYPDGTIYIYPE